MHKLIEFLCDELEELERKADKEGKLSMAEVQYLDTLAHAKKNLMKAEEMSDEYSERGYSRRGEGSYGMRDNSYARDRMGRYSRRYSMAGDDMIAELHSLMESAPDEQTKREFRKFISKVESM